MKKKICMLLLLQYVLIVFSGCSINNFFDVESTMFPPQVSGDETEIESVINDYLNCDFKFCQLFMGGRYASVLKYNFSNERYIIVFCQTEDVELKSHIILLENMAGHYVIREDIVKKNVELGSARIVHINSDEFCELIAEGVDKATNLETTFSWRIYSNGTIEVNI